MKKVNKLLNFAVIIAILSVATSCKKAEPEQPKEKTVEELIVGKWQFSSGTKEYYDDTNKKVYEEPIQLTLINEFDGKKYTLSFPGFSESTDYSIIRENASDYIQITVPGLKYKILIESISDTNLNTSQESLNADSYVDKTTNMVVYVPKSVFKYSFTKIK